MYEGKKEEAARAYAQWFLGDPGWADRILRAYDDPESTWELLANEGMERAISRRESRAKR